MDKDKNKKFGVKREMRTDSENEPTRVYRPRTLKARPVSTSDENVDDNRLPESEESTHIESEKSQENHSDDKPLRKRKSTFSDDGNDTIKPSSRSKETPTEHKSTYKPRTGGFKKSNEDFAAEIDRNDEKPTVEKTNISTKRVISHDRKSDDIPFRKKEDRFDLKRNDQRRTSRNTNGKPTGYLSSREDKKKPFRESNGERVEGFRRPRISSAEKTKFEDRSRDRKPYGSMSESDRNSKLRLVLPGKGEKKYIDKPIPKPKRNYDDKPFLEVDSEGLIRLNKYISNTGLCSRREADEFIENGMITVNGEVVSQLGTKIDPNAEVCFKGKKLETEHKVYILLNKPKDYITTVEDPNAKRTVMELIEGACTERVYPVGRLDRNSTGLLLLTNDGEMTKRLTHPSFMKKKIYHVGLDKVLTREDMEKMISGVEIEGEAVKADAVEYTEKSDGTEVGVEIHSGQNRVVRNMFDVLGYKVSSLDRVYFAGLTKKNLPRGKWRFLTQNEINMLKMNRFE